GAPPVAAGRARHAEPTAARDRRPALLRRSQRGRGRRPARRLHRNGQEHCLTSGGPPARTAWARRPARHQRLPLKGRKIMPATDEDLLRDLMHRATGDLHAPSEITTGIVTASRRRYRRTRALGVGVTGAAAAAVGVAAVASGATGPAGRSTRSGGSDGAIELTAAQRTLNHLSARAAATTTPAGRWVKM